MSAYVPTVEQIIEDLTAYFSTNYHISGVREDDDLNDILAEAGIGEDKDETIDDFLEGLQEEMGVADLDLQGVSTVSDLAEAIHTEIEGASKDMKRKTDKQTRDVKSTAERAKNASAEVATAETAAAAAPAEAGAVEGVDGGGGNHTGKVAAKKVASKRVSARR